ncbi:MAG: M48 family metallopeptidase [Methylobacillus sp.]|jgi:predicted Zn-dependent protease|nr:M48 family metallopeptidase [Methylobacillus sp.]
MKNTLLALFLALLLAGCATTQTTKSGAVGVDRKQYVGLVSEEEAVQQSALAYQQVVKDADAKRLLNTDSAETKRVRVIGERLIAQVGTFREDALKWDWQINVMESKEVNAYCMAGGKIMVYTGLLDAIKPTDDELAAVMGHEISHALREHVREQMSRVKAQQYGLLGLAIAVGVATGSGDAASQTADVGNQLATVALTLPNSRTAENEADGMGLELMARAGYNPNAALTLWQKMSSLGGEKPAEILSTHPSDQTRMDHIKGLIPKVMPLYDQAKNSSAASVSPASNSLKNNTTQKKK